MIEKWIGQLQISLWETSTEKLNHLHIKEKHFQRTGMKVSLRAHLSQGRPAAQEAFSPWLEFPVDPSEERVL